MSTYGESFRIIDYGSLPRINGILIESIWGKVTTAYERETYNNSPRIDKREDYYLCQPCFRSNKPLKLKVLPDEINDLFKKYNLSNLWFRTSDSGHGGGVDSAAVGNVPNHLRTQHVYYRYDETNTWKSSTYCHLLNSDFGLMVENILNKNYTVDVLPDYYDVTFPVTHLRTESGINYPDTKISSWRGLYGKPYVCMTYGDKRNIRFFDEKTNSHYYLQLATDEELKKGISNALYINFKDHSFLSTNLNVLTHKKTTNNTKIYKIMKILKS